jgi:hypothetical protein
MDVSRKGIDKVEIRMEIREGCSAPQIQYKEHCLMLHDAQYRKVQPKPKCLPVFFFWDKPHIE